MKVVGIDLAIHTGWAVATKDEGPVELLDYGMAKIKGKEGPLRYLNAYKVYGKLLDTYKPDAVAVEQVNFAKFRLAYGSFRALKSVLGLACAERSLALHEVDTGELKRFWTGKKTATKTDMCRTAREKFYIDLRSEEEKGPKGQEDMADAIAVANWYLITQVEGNCHEESLITTRAPTGTRRVHKRSAPRSSSRRKRAGSRK